MSRARLALAGCALAALALPLAPLTPAGAEGPHYNEYVALGDSWSADVVIANLEGLPDATYAPIDCAQSKVNYPKLVAKALGVAKFADASALATSFG